MFNSPRRDSRGRVPFPDRKELVHTPNERRIPFSHEVAQFIEDGMRRDAAAAGEQSTGDLCPGCFMTTLINASIILARKHKLNMEELGSTMGQEYLDIAVAGEIRREIPLEILAMLGATEEDMQKANGLILGIHEAPALPQPIRQLLAL